MRFSNQTAINATHYPRLFKSLFRLDHLIRKNAVAQWTRQPKLKKSTILVFGH